MYLRLCPWTHQFFWVYIFFVFCQDTKMWSKLHYTTGVQKTSMARVKQNPEHVSVYLARRAGRTQSAYPQIKPIVQNSWAKRFDYLDDELKMCDARIKQNDVRYGRGSIESRLAWEIYDEIYAARSRHQELLQSFTEKDHDEFLEWYCENENGNVEGDKSCKIYEV